MSYLDVSVARCSSGEADGAAAGSALASSAATMAADTVPPTRISLVNNTIPP